MVAARSRCRQNVRCFCEKSTYRPPRLILRGQACKCSFLSSISDTRALCFGLCDFFVVETVCHHQEEIRLAVASRSPVDEGGAARGILGALGLIDKFCCLEIHRGSKAVHFQVGSLFDTYVRVKQEKGRFIGFSRVMSRYIGDVLALVV